jgi:WD40 repeat protein
LLGVLGVGEPHPDSVDALAFSPDGSLLAARTCAERDGSLCLEWQIWLWDIAEERVAHVLGDFVSMMRPWLAFSPDGRLLASPACVDFDEEGWCQDFQLRLWDTQAGTIVRRFALDVDWVFAMDWFSDGTRLALSGGLVGEVRDGIWILDAETGEVVAHHAYDEYDVLCWGLDVAPDDSALAVGHCLLGEHFNSAGASVHILSAVDLSEIASAPAEPLLSIDQIAYSSDGSLLAVLDPFETGQVNVYAVSR